MKYLKIRWIAVLLVAVGTSFFFGFKSGDNRSFQVAKNLDIFNSIVKELDMFYVDTIDPNKTIRTGIESMLYSLDPYTQYFPEDDQSELEQMLKNTYGGIGSIITWNTKLKRSMIAEPYEHMPAATVGLKAGDILMEIDGKDLAGKNNQEVSEMLRGQVGTSFKLKVQRPGTEQPLQSAEEAVRICNEIGYPVMLKASMGGGGKGMRLIHNENEVVEAYNTARSESMSSFGDDTVYLEKFVEEPHHIEFQILGDNHGNVVHLFDRECSVQRRNQKIVEESPSPFLTPELRKEMGEKAVAAAKAVNYSGAGTIEFLVDKNRNFYFLEMNTRLQVEHPITEEVVGVDLVKEQIRIANDEVLHLRQEELFQRGHAIECRICAEDTENNFMPSPGIIKQLTEPNGIGVRIDSYVYEGYEIPIYYDPMIGKLIVWATTRQYAIERMRRVLYEYKITGLKTNLSYLKRIMHTPDFVKGEYNTLFIEKNSRMLLRSNGNNEEIENIAMIASYIDYLMNLEENKSSQLPDGRPISRWREFGLQKGVLRI